MTAQKRIGTNGFEVQILADDGGDRITLATCSEADADRIVGILVGRRSHTIAVDVRADVVGVGTV